MFLLSYHIYRHAIDIVQYTLVYETKKCTSVVVHIWSSNSSLSSSRIFNQQCQLLQQFMYYNSANLCTSYFEFMFFDLTNFSTPYSDNLCTILRQVLYFILQLCTMYSVLYISRAYEVQILITTLYSVLGSFYCSMEYGFGFWVNFYCNTFWIVLIIVWSTMYFVLRTLYSLYSVLYYNNLCTSYYTLYSDNLCILLRLRLNLYSVLKIYILRSYKLMYFVLQQFIYYTHCFKNR